MDQSVYEERREAVAARITSKPKLFNMKAWAEVTTCGTVACIAGHAALLAAERQEIKYSPGEPAHIFTLDGEFVDMIRRWAAEWLGVPDVGGDLFSYGAPHQAPEDAALALKCAPYEEEK